MSNSNWPGGVDYGHSNHTLKFPRTSKWQGGAWEEGSHKIPLFEAFCYVAGTAAVVLATYRIALWIIQQG